MNALLVIVSTLYAHGFKQMEKWNSYGLNPIG
jgi:hypothetical protein